MISKLMESTVLVTGCSGFIGSHLCNLLLRKYHCNITGIDSMAQPVIQRDDLSSSKSQGGSEPSGNSKDGKFSFHTIDISNPEDLDTFLKSRERFDFIFHLAAIANPPSL